MNENPNPIYLLFGAIAVFSVLFAMHMSRKRKMGSVLKPDTKPESAAAQEEMPQRRKFDPQSIMSPIKSELFGRIVSLDTFHEDLVGQLPLNIRFIRPIPHPDGANYVLAALHSPLVFKGEIRSFLIVCGHFEGTRIGKGMKGFPIKVAIVLDETVVEDKELDFAKVEYVSLGTCDEIPKNELA